MSELRIGYLTGEYPRATDTFIQREVAAMRRRGVEVQTFSIRRPDEKHIVGEEQREEHRRTVYVQETAAWRIVLAHLRLLLSRPGRYIKTLWLAMRMSRGGVRAMLWQLFYFVEAGIVAEAGRRLNLRHIHNHFANSSCSVTMLAAELGGFTFSFTMHGPAIFFEPMRWRIDEKIRRALFVACISHFCRSQAMIFAPYEKWSRLHIVHCGVDPKGFEPKEHAGSARRLLYVGRLDVVKGLPVLFEALAKVSERHSQLRLDLIGDGLDRQRLEELAERLSIADRVGFLGYRSQAEVRKELAESDGFVMSSFAEGVPVVLMEAMAAGLPVIATRIAGVAELVEEGASGYLVPPGDADSLADRIDRLAVDPERRAAMGRVGRQAVAESFNLEREAAWLCRVLRSALEGRVEPVRPADVADDEESGEKAAAVAGASAGEAR